MADGGLRAVRDDRVVGGDAVLAEDALDRCLHPLARQGLAVDAEDAVRLLGAAEQRPRLVHRRLAGALGAADAGQLGLVLPAAAGDEERPVPPDLDAALAQPVGDLERERRRHDGARDADLATDAHGHLAEDLLVVEPLLLQLVAAEALEGVDLEPAVGLRDPVGLEAADDDEAAVAVLDVEEGIRDADRHLVPDLRVPERVADDQDIAHERRILTAASAEAASISSSSWTRRSRRPRS